MKYMIWLGLAILGPVVAAGAQEFDATITKVRGDTLSGLALISGQAPAYDPRVAEKAILKNFECLGPGNTPAQRLMCLSNLNNSLDNYGAGIMYRSSSLMDNFDQYLLRPVETNLNGFYSSRDNDLQMRYLTMLCLRKVATTYSYGASGPANEYQVHLRIKQVFKNMSTQEPNGRLRELARLTYRLIQAP